MGSIRWNRLMWGNPDNWTLGGDSWDFHARYCDQPYESWKDSVVKEFLTPHLAPGIDAVEIGPGQGRWSRFMIENARSLALVDLSANCISVCRRRFANGDGARLSFFVNDGTSIPVGDSSIDLVWSFGTFVHIELPEIDLYLGEIKRVLRPGGIFVIHHAGRSEDQRDPRLDRKSTTQQGPVPSPDDLLSAASGLRSAVSARQFANLVARHDLLLDGQVRTWGTHCEYGLAFEDVISTGRRPSSS